MGLTCYSLINVLLQLCKFMNFRTFLRVGFTAIFLLQLTTSLRSHKTESFDINSLINVQFMRQQDMNALFKKVKTEPHLKSKRYSWSNMSKNISSNVPRNTRKKRETKSARPTGKSLVKLTPKAKTEHLYKILKTTVNKNRLSVPEKINDFAKKLLTEFKKYLPIAFLQVKEQMSEVFVSGNGLVDRKIKLANVIGIIPGARRCTKKDNIIVIGAHYDTVEKVKGVYDNGSGVAVLLETARLLGTLEWKQENTIIFVSFDYEESGFLGSISFVNDYLIPKIIEAGKGRLKAAYLFDSILLYNTTENTQRIVDSFTKHSPELVKKIKANKRRSDFALLWARKGIDDEMAEKLTFYWNLLEKPEYKLFTADINNEKIMRESSLFKRSDHISFWNMLAEENMTLNAILGTDGGSRGGGDCMHQQCDNFDLVKPEGVYQMKKMVDALVAAVLDFAEAKPHKDTC